jgi:hypothetical protein
MGLYMLSGIRQLPPRRAAVRLSKPRLALAALSCLRSGAYISRQQTILVVTANLRTGMISASATDVQKNFDEYGRKAAVEPVEVQHGDHSKSYLISERMFRHLLASYRRAMRVEELSDEDVALIERAEVVTDEPYNLDDIPEVDDTLSVGR